MSNFRVQRSSDPIARASRFCGWASGIDPSLAQRASKSFLGHFALELINRSTVKHQKFWASRNDLRARTSWPQTARRAGWKIELLCTLNL